MLHNWLKMSICGPKDKYLFNFRLIWPVQILTQSHQKKVETLSWPTTQYFHSSVVTIGLIQNHGLSYIIYINLLILAICLYIYYPIYVMSHKNISNNDLKTNHNTTLKIKSSQTLIKRNKILKQRTGKGDNVVPLKPNYLPSPFHGKE